MKFVLAFLQHRICVHHFFNGNDHGEHNADMSICTCPQKSPELCLQNLFLIQADADCPVSKERIFFLWKLKIIQAFIAADVQSPDGQLTFSQKLSRLSVYIELLFLRWKMVALHVEELTSEKSDSVNPELHGIFHVFQASHVSAYLQLSAVCRNGGKSAGFFQFLLASIKLVCFLFIFFNYFRFRVNNNYTTGGVHDYKVTGTYRVHNSFYPDKRRDTHPSCHDRYVACHTAQLCDKSQNIFQVQLRRIRRRQIPCNQDHFFGNRIKIPVTDPFQLTHQAVSDIQYICSTLTHVLVFHHLKDHAEFFRGFMQRLLCAV